MIFCDTDQIQSKLVNMRDRQFNGIRFAEIKHNLNCTAAQEVADVFAVDLQEKSLTLESHIDERL